MVSHGGEGVDWYLMNDVMNLLSIRSSDRRNTTTELGETIFDRVVDDIVEVMGQYTLSRILLPSYTIYKTMIIPEPIGSQQ
jgi:hypothetical protein